MRGSVTAELALTFPVVVAVLALLMGAAAAGTQQIRLNDSAALVARALARGDPAPQALSHGTQRAGQQAAFTVEHLGEARIRVSVSAPAPGILAVGGWVLEASATVRAESSAGSEAAP